MLIFFTSPSMNIAHAKNSFFYTRLLMNLYRIYGCHTFHTGSQVIVCVVRVSCSDVISLTMSGYSYLYSIIICIVCITVSSTSTKNDVCCLLLHSCWKCYRWTIRLLALSMSTYIIRISKYDVLNKCDGLWRIGTFTEPFFFIPSKVLFPHFSAPYSITEPQTLYYF